MVTGQAAFFAGSLCRCYVARMTPAPWHLTHTALVSYAFARGWVQTREAAEHDDGVLNDAEDGLTCLMPAAGYRARDRYGRELWRSPKRTGGGLRWVIDPRVQPPNLPEVIWVGFGAPPTRVWAP